MKKLTVLLLFLSLSGFSQEFEDSNWTNYMSTPFDPKGESNTYGIKAKILPFFIGNSFGIYNSLGTEIGFFKNQSFTAEWFFNYGQGSHDEVVDINGNEYDSGNRSHMNEHALQLGYRYYYGLNKLRQRGVLFYNGLFFRAEKGKTNNDPNFDNIYITQTRGVKAFGLLTGMTYVFVDNEHFGIDGNVSLGRGFYTTEEYDREDGLYFSTQEKETKFYFNLGISLNYWF